MEKDITKSGETVQRFTNQGSFGNPVRNSNVRDLGDFIKTNDNKGVIRNSFINRFGNNNPQAKLPTE